MADTFSPGATVRYSAASAAMYTSDVVAVGATPILM